MNKAIARTAEHVSEGHPDKFCDQVADGVLDEVLRLAGDDHAARALVRTAIECLAKDNLLIVSGEANLPPEVWARLDVSRLAREAWTRIGYGVEARELTVIDHIHTQSPDIAVGDGSGGVDLGDRAGDQGIMVGYATSETPEFMPREWVYARNLCQKLAALRKSGELPWLKSDCKSQVTMSAEGEVISVIVAAQHAEGVAQEEIEGQIRSQVIEQVLPDVPRRVVINGTGVFLIGGPTGDAGVVGRKIVVDAYGPRVPVGGGAYSGKDPTKVDRSGAYMARHIAKTAVAERAGGAEECFVTLAYGIGQLQPEMVTATTQDGSDISDWARGRFTDLSPGAIIERFGLRRPDGWSYRETAAYGHYGRSIFPWERLD
jgi:S-adenosylmethionine synthetase